MANYNIIIPESTESQGGTSSIGTVTADYILGMTCHLASQRILFVERSGTSTNVYDCAYNGTGNISNVRNLGDHGVGHCQGLAMVGNKLIIHGATNIYDLTYNPTTGSLGSSRNLGAHGIGNLQGMTYDGNGRLLVGVYSTSSLPSGITNNYVYSYAYDPVAGTLSDFQTVGTFKITIGGLAFHNNKLICMRYQNGSGMRIADYNPVTGTIGDSRTFTTSYIGQGVTYHPSGRIVFAEGSFTTSILRATQFSVTNNISPITDSITRVKGRAPFYRTITDSVSNTAETVTAVRDGIDYTRAPATDVLVVEDNVFASRELRTYNVNLIEGMREHSTGNLRKITSDNADDSQDLRAFVPFNNHILSIRQTGIQSFSWAYANYDPDTGKIDETTLTLRQSSSVAVTGILETEDRWHAYYINTSNPGFTAAVSYTKSPGGGPLAYSTITFIHNLGLNVNAAAQNIISLMVNGTRMYFELIFQTGDLRRVYPKTTGDWSFDSAIGRLQGRRMCAGPTPGTILSTGTNDHDIYIHAITQESDGSLTFTQGSKIADIDWPIRNLMFHPVHNKIFIRRADTNDSYDLDVVTADPIEIIDEITVNKVATTIKNVTRTLTETLTISDAVDRTLGAMRQPATETLAYSDGVIKDVSKTVEELTILIEDSISKHVHKILEEVITVVDQVVAGSGYVRAVPLETLTDTESIETEKGVFRLIDTSSTPQAIDGLSTATTLSGSLTTNVHGITFVSDAEILTIDRATDTIQSYIYNDATKTISDRTDIGSITTDSDPFPAPSGIVFLPDTQRILWCTTAGEIYRATYNPVTRTKGSTTRVLQVGTVATPSGMCRLPGGLIGIIERTTNQMVIYQYHSNDIINRVGITSTRQGTVMRGVASNETDKVFTVNTARKQVIEFDWVAGTDINGDPDYEIENDETIATLESGTLTGLTFRGQVLLAVDRQAANVIHWYYGTTGIGGPLLNVSDEVEARKIPHIKIIENTIITRDDIYKMVHKFVHEDDSGFTDETVTALRGHLRTPRDVLDLIHENVLAEKDNEHIRDVEEDDVTYNDSITRMHGRLRKIVARDVGVIDEIARVGVFGRTAHDVIGPITETLHGTKQGTIQIQEFITITDMVNVGFFRDMADVITTLAESIEKAVTKIISETVNDSDNVVASKGKIANVNEIIYSFADAVARVFVGTRILVETITIVDAVSTGNSRVVQEIHNITDTINKHVSKGISDTISYSETFAWRLQKVLTDIMNPINETVNTGNNVVLGLTINITDDVSRIAVLGRRMTETLNTITETITTRKVRGAIILREIITISNIAVNRMLAAVRTLMETIHVVDDVGTDGQKSRHLPRDIIGMTDTVMAPRSRSISLSDTLNAIVDAVSASYVEIIDVTQIWINRHLLQKLRLRRSPTE